MPAAPYCMLGHQIAQLVAKNLAWEVLHLRCRRQLAHALAPTSLVSE